MHPVLSNFACYNICTREEKEASMDNGFFIAVLFGAVLGFVISFFTDRPNSEDDNSETVDKS